MEAAIEAAIKLGAGISIDGYLMGDGTFRYGLAYISGLLGYAENYYRRLLNPQRTKTTPKKLKALMNKGFTAYQIAIKASRVGVGGSLVAHTVSFNDFCLLVEHEAEIGNPKALAILTASFRELLRGRTQAAFGLPEDTLEEKQLSFQFNYEHYLEDKAELDDLYLPGDELYYPQYRDWEAIEPWTVKCKSKKTA